MTQHRCPITYEVIAQDKKYSSHGLKLLSPKLVNLADLPLSADELRREAMRRQLKMSIQGVQPKLSANISAKEEAFAIVDINGKFILKPPLSDYPDVPANEDVTMRMAKTVGIEVPLHGLVYNSDASFTYFIKRFDRKGHKDKIPLEDFAQLAGKNRHTKYNYSMEKLIPILDNFCTFPGNEKIKLFLRVLFNYVVGNEDMHLKNFSLITNGKVIQLAPAYDFLNTTIATGNAREELALPLNGKKSNLTFRDLVDYYGLEKLNINQLIINKLLLKLQSSLPLMVELIDISFLSLPMKNAYKSLLLQRAKSLKLI